MTNGNTSTFGLVASITAGVVALGVIATGSLRLGSISASVDQQQQVSAQLQRDQAELRAKLDETSERLTATTAQVNSLVGQVGGIQAQQQSTVEKVDGVVKDVIHLLDLAPGDGKRSPH